MNVIMAGADRERERFHAAVVEHMREGCAHARVVHDGGRPVDLEYIRVNPAFEKLTGWRNVAGRRLSELLPKGREWAADFFELIGKLQPGDPTATFDTEALGGSYSLLLYCPAAGEVAIIFENTTERKRIEAAILESDERLDILFNRAPIGKLMTAPDGRIRRANPTLADMLGYSTAELESLRFQDITHADDVALSEAGMRALVEGKLENFTAEKRYLTKQGAVVWAHVVTRLLRRDPAVDLFLTYIIDINERKRAQLALAASEERFRALVKNFPDAIYSVSDEGRITSLNPAFEAITGWPAEDWIGREFVELIDVADRPLAIAEYQKALAGNHCPAVEIRVRCANGKTKQTEITGFRTPKGDGTFEIQGVGRDVTERRAAERLVREHAEIIANAGEGIMIVNSEDVITYWNRGAEEIFGWADSEALGQRPEDLLGIDNMALVENLRRSVERRGRWTGEVRGRGRDGRPIVFVSRVTVVRDDAGKLRGRVSFITDVTETTTLGEKLIEVQRRESIGMLAAGIAHDLNNVLAPVMFAGPLLRESLTDPNDLKLLDILDKAAARGAALVRRIVAFVRNTEVELTPVRLADVAHELIAMVESTFPRSIQFTHDVPDLPPIMANATQLYQVLLNLCVNARDAMPAAGKLHVRAFARTLDGATVKGVPEAMPGNWLTFEIVDTGKGMSPEILEAIWTPFFTTKSSGTGLGLATVREIVRRHNGFVEVESAVERGTSFRVNLPSIVHDNPVEGSAAGRAGIRGGGELLLVVDDDEAVRNVIALALEGAGFRVVRCSDGVEAEAVFMANPASVAAVISDVDMPRCGGAALARKLVALRPELRVLAISGMSASTHGGQSSVELRQIAHGFLLKPFTTLELFAAVRALIPSCAC